MRMQMCDGQKLVPTETEVLLVFGSYTSTREQAQ